MACPEELVIFTCTGTGTDLTWSSSGFENPVDYSTFVHSVGTVQSRAMNTFIANLTHIGSGTIASTLSVTATASLNGTSVECLLPAQNQTTILEVINGVIRMRSLICLLFLCFPPSTAPPTHPQFLQLVVSEYGEDGATVIVQWMYPDDGHMADNFTVSLSVGESVTTTEMMATIEDVPYNQPLNISVVATNCNGRGPSVSFKGST